MQYQKIKGHCIYMHKNKINGKIYIGQAKGYLCQRWRKNGQGYKESPYFYRAIQKYGWDNFEHTVLIDGLTQEEANQKQQDFIRLYKTMDANFGYNLQAGGGVGHQLAVESRRKISQAQKGVKIPVVCIQTGEFFDSLTEAAKKISKVDLTKDCRESKNILKKPVKEKLLQLMGFIGAILKTIQNRKSKLKCSKGQNKKLLLNVFRQEMFLLVSQKHLENTIFQELEFLMFYRVPHILVEDFTGREFKEIQG